MRYKKRKLHKLHSIPIGLCNKEKLYLVSYSIPLSCMVVLLLGFSVVVNPGLFLVDKSSAVTIQDEWTVKNNTSSDSAADGSNDVIPIDDESLGITFSIGGADRDAVIDAAPGAVAYREHTVAIEIRNADEYALLISGQDELVSDSNDSAKLIGMTNPATGNNIPAGQWGYGWDSTGSIDKENMTYQAVSINNKELPTPKINASTKAIRFTGKLNFAGKFPDGAAADKYTGGTAKLTLVVSPEGNTGGALWKKADGSDSNYYSGITSMQEVDIVTRDGGFCNEAIQPGWTIELQDNRGSNPVTTYTIYKASDGNCWMGQNLALSGPQTLTPANSDVATNWELPASVGSNGKINGNINTSNNWSTSSQDMVQIRTGDVTLSDWNRLYGNYYSWPAATAGTGTTSILEADASSSICPRGWKLPRGYSFNNLIQGTDGYASEWLTNQTIAGVAGISGYRLGYDGILSSNNFANFWPAAGRIYTNKDQLDRAGVLGFYWARGSGDNRLADFLYLTESSATAGRNDRYNGYPVRCIVDEKNGVWKNNSGTLEAEYIGFKTMQEATAENFTNKYCSSSQNSKVSVGATIRLIDARDGNPYTIVKLKDGNCWMQQNLRLQAMVDGGLTLTPDNSDVDSNWTLPKTLVSSDGASVSGWSTDDTIIQSATFNNVIFGNYYSWCAATAGTCSSATANNAVAVNSICPKGWHLPTGGGDSNSRPNGGTGELGALLNGLDRNTIIASPYSFPTAGNVNQHGSLVNAGTTSPTGFYWSSTTSGLNFAYSLRFSNSELYPGTANEQRYYGRPIRCIADY